jgi:hypothetical protein
MKRATRLLAIGSVGVFLLTAMSGGNATPANLVPPRKPCGSPVTCILQYTAATGAGVAVGALTFLAVLYLASRLSREDAVRPGNER